MSAIFLAIGIGFHNSVIILILVLIFSIYEDKYEIKSIFKLKLLILITLIVELSIVYLLKPIIKNSYYGSYGNDTGIATNTFLAVLITLVFNVINRKSKKYNAVR